MYNNELIHFDIFFYVQYSSVAYQTSPELPDYLFC